MFVLDPMKFLKVQKPHCEISVNCMLLFVSVRCLMLQDIMPTDS
jgi:hypothetical protein